MSRGARFIHHPCFQSLFSQQLKLAYIVHLNILCMFGLWVCELFYLSLWVEGDLMWHDSAVSDLLLNGITEHTFFLLCFLPYFFLPLTFLLIPLVLYCINASLFFMSLLLLSSLRPISNHPAHFSPSTSLSSPFNICVCKTGCCRQS